MIPSWCLAVCSRLETAGVRYIAVSGTAVVLHGFVRPSADLDVVISRGPDEVARAMDALMRAGFMPSLPLPMSAVTVMRMFDSSQREVDVFVRSYERSMSKTPFGWCEGFAVLYNGLRLRHADQVSG